MRAREKSNQSLDLFQTLRDEKRGPHKNEVFGGVKINREVCLISRRRG